MYYPTNLAWTLVSLQHVCIVLGTIKPLKDISIFFLKSCNFIHYDDYLSCTMYNVI